ncbi:anthranilate phosphoribosyltransferase [Nanchangia anserum]|uniref:Anthranilate phosphoribosyltransferase n=1 Tax=Nanchangia anserum TaxID=2692125 RepID=A0A8I0G6T2_9ACTO|nr:anthranilate phosphoribosyltransferase [Nanchangia anserum]MBD3688847.1 anthranilate phosphoribosyltransferase [Nanchangia anserum]
MTTFPELFDKLRNHEDLSYDEASWAMDQIMTDRVPPAQIAGLLMALGTKGETATEIRGLADRMQAHALRADLPTDVLDIVGTGGDGLKTVNISTSAAMVLAAAGVPVVKHGNRATTSACGSADVMEALGVDLYSDPGDVAAVFASLGITFLFANVFHPAMRFVAPVRRELGYPTAFNILGPLTNPARPRASAVGVASEQAAPVVAGVFAERGADAMVFRGTTTRLDEISQTDINDVWETHDGVIEHYQCDARDVGIEPANVECLRGGDAEHNAAVIRRVFAGEPGPVADAVALNVAVGLMAYNRTEGCRVGDGTPSERLRRGVEVARETIASGKAQALLEKWASFTRES